MKYSQKELNKCEWQIDQARMGRVVCSFEIVRPSARPRQGRVLTSKLDERQSNKIRTNNAVHTGEM